MFKQNKNWLNKPFKKQTLKKVNKNKTKLLFSKKKIFILKLNRYYLKSYLINKTFKKNIINNNVVKFLLFRFNNPSNYQFKEIENLKFFFLKKITKYKTKKNNIKLLIKMWRNTALNIYSKRLVLLQNSLFFKFKLIEQLSIQNYQILNNFNFIKIDNKLKLNYMHNSDRFYLNEEYLKKHNYFNEFIVNEKNNLITKTFSLNVNCINNLKKKLKKIIYIYKLNLFNNKLFLKNYEFSGKFPKDDDFFGPVYKFKLNTFNEVKNNISFKGEKFNDIKFLIKKVNKFNVLKINKYNNTENFKLFDKKNKLKLFKNKVKTKRDNYKNQWNKTKYDLNFYDLNRYWKDTRSRVINMKYLQDSEKIINYKNIKKKFNKNQIMSFLSIKNKYFYKFITIQLNRYYKSSEIEKNIFLIKINRIIKNLKKSFSFNLHNNIKLKLIKKNLKTKQIKVQNKRKYNWYIRLKSLKLFFFKKKLNNIINFNIKINKNISKNCIHDFTFLNKHAIKHYMIGFHEHSKQNTLFLKKKKHNVYKKRKKTLFVNMWKKKLTTWKKARHYHWNMFSNKTLKTRRYKNFLPPFMSKVDKNIETIINFFSFKFCFSHIFWKSFSIMYNQFFKKKLKEREVYQIPISLIFWKHLKEIKNNKLKIKFKVKLWLKRRVRIKQRFWMEFKKKIPKFFLKQIYTVSGLLNKIHYDFLTNYFCIIKKQKLLTLTNQVIYNNKLLKLHDFRYKS